MEAVVPISTHTEASHERQVAHGYRQTMQHGQLLRRASSGPAHDMKFVALAFALPPTIEVPLCSAAAKSSPPHLLLRRAPPVLRHHQRSLVVQSCRKPGVSVADGVMIIGPELVRTAVDDGGADLWCRFCESVGPGRSRSTTAHEEKMNDCSRVSSGVDSEVESRPASTDFESLTLRSRVIKYRARRPSRAVEGGFYRKAVD
jgi:hypothetical protein